MKPKEDFDLLVEGARPYIPQTIKAAQEIQELVKKRDLDGAYSGDKFTGCDRQEDTE